MSSNAEKILRALDSFLDHETDLVIYGRAALALGFSNPPVETTKSEGVDVILPLSQLAKIEGDEQFWQAQEKTNAALQPMGLYMLHLFAADQLFLRADWEEHIVPVYGLDLLHLRVFRPGTLDLILTKTIRGDDEQDIAFMIRHDKLTRSQVEEALEAVIIPDLQEFRDALACAKPEVLAIFEGVH